MPSSRRGRDASPGFPVISLMLARRPNAPAAPARRSLVADAGRITSPRRSATLARQAHALPDTWQYGPPRFGDLPRHHDLRRSRRVLDGDRRSLDAGVNFIDTADVYSEGHSEEITGQAIRNSGRPRTDVVLATKVFGPTGRGINDRGASRGHIMDGLKASLRRLGMDYIDLYQIHAFDPVTPVEETLRALED